MKIAIDISQIVHEGTGVATYTDQLIRNLLKIDTENEYILFGISLRKLRLLTNYFTGLKTSHKNLESKFFSIPPTAGEFLWNRLHLVKMENLLGSIDIFHSSDWIQPPTAAKKITTIHDLLVYEYPDVSHPYIVETQKRRLKWVMQECDAIITDSIFTKNRLAKIMKVDFPNTEVVYPGIMNKFRPADKEAIRKVKQKYGLYDDYILSVGTVEPRKNLIALLKAFEQFLKHPLISNRNRPMELVIVGKYGWGEKIAKAKNVKILGFVPEDDLPVLYSGATMFVYPSLYEGFGFPILEAMACGCPVITSDHGSLKELATGAAVIIDPESTEDIMSKMIQLFVDQELRAELVKQGKKNIERFNWEKTAGEVLKIYKRLFI